LKKVDSLPEVDAKSASAFKIQIMQEDILNKVFNPLACELSIETRVKS
jgi:hypothetical protein